MVARRRAGRPVRRPRARESCVDAFGVVAEGRLDNILQRQLHDAVSALAGHQPVRSPCRIGALAREGACPTLKADAQAQTELSLVDAVAADARGAGGFGEASES